MSDGDNAHPENHSQGMIHFFNSNVLPFRTVEVVTNQPWSDIRIRTSGSALQQVMSETSCSSACTQQCIELHCNIVLQAQTGTVVMWIRYVG